MIVHTFQIGKWRKVDLLDIPRLDITIKSGEWLLAPTWSLLMTYRTGDINAEQYTEVYNALLEERYALYPEYFKDLTQRTTVALGCYCKAGVFCHRLLLVEFLKSITGVEYAGEIT